MAAFKAIFPAIAKYGIASMAGYQLSDMISVRSSPPEIVRAPVQEPKVERFDFDDLTKLILIVLAVFLLFGLLCKMRSSLKKSAQKELRRQLEMRNIEV